jgi:hypothetical protein
MSRFATLLKKLCPSGSRGRRAGRHASSFTPRLEALEDRMTPTSLFTVTTLSDNLFHSGTSLRDAVNLANANPGSTIQFAPGLRGTIGLALGEIDIRQSMEIDGPGAAALTIDAHQQSRVLAVLNPSSTVTVQGLTLTGGRATLIKGEVLPEGGGVINRGNLTLRASIVSGNSTPLQPGVYQSQPDGGGLDNDGGTLTVIACTLSGNNSAGNGGCISNDGGTLTVTNSTLSGNCTGVGGFGGGIFNYAGTATVTNSTLSGNSGSWNGGGICNWISGSLIVANSTLSDNSARVPGFGDRGGGGIFNASTLTLTNSTLYGNSAPGFGGGLVNYGTATLTSVTVTNNVSQVVPGFTAGGVFDNGVRLLLHNTIVAGNFQGSQGGAASDVNLQGFVDPSSSYNLIGVGVANGGSGALTPGVNHNQVGVLNPGLAPLADNRGPTKTCALLSGSPASGNGDPSLQSTTDQRGVARTGYVSIGAYQDPAPPPPAPPLPDPGDGPPVWVYGSAPPGMPRPHQHV